MKHLSIASLSIALLTVACGGSESSADRVIATSTDKKAPVANNVRRNESPVPLFGNSKNVDKMNDGIGSGFQEYLQQQAAAESKKEAQAAAKLKHDAEQAALNRAADAALEDKRLASKEKSEIVGLFSEAMKASMMLKMFHPDPCANESFIDGLSDLGKGIGDGLSATKKGLNAPVESEEKTTASTAVAAEPAPEVSGKSEIGFPTEIPPAAPIADGPGEASMTKGS